MDCDNMSTMTVEGNVSCDNTLEMTVVENSWKLTVMAHNQAMAAEVRWRRVMAPTTPKRW